MARKPSQDPSKAANSSHSPAPHFSANPSVRTASPTHIVGVGASAGGLEALETFFDHVPPDSGLAFVVIQHLSPDFKSLMDELLARHTKLRILRAEDGMPVEPNTIYLLPARNEMIVQEGRLSSINKEPAGGLLLPIDTFFRSLAQDAGERAIGIVLSGTGSDGSRGIRAISDTGGLVIAQREDTAKFDGMPRSAIDTGVVDVVLPPAEIPAALVRYCQRDGGLSALFAGEGQAEKGSAIGSILALLREEYGIDFSYYKPTTVRRRIQRRLDFAHSKDIDDYLATLRHDPGERNALYKDLLIGVTKFFRDREAFAELERRVIPAILDRRPPEEEIRVWVAGCATGEEAYSIAILFYEALAARRRPLNVKIFATDVHRASLDFASAGVYSESSVSSVSPERLRRFFQPKGPLYHVSKELRSMIAFAQHDVIRDAPFTKIDLITCRNVLIYLEPKPQKKVIALFHFALNPNGVMFLGPSESPGELAEEFAVLDNHWRLYRKRRDVKLPPDLRFPVISQTTPQVRPVVSRPEQSPPDLHMLRAYDRILERFAPPALLVNERRELVHTFGGVGDYLTVQRGRRTSHVLDLVEDELKVALATGLGRAARDKTEVVIRGIRAKSIHGEATALKVTVLPLSDRSGSFEWYLVQLEAEETAPQPDSPPTDEIDVTEVSRERILVLETELRYAKENLQATIQEMETTNEELQATNEELVASNEELQSTNEELQSVNEELYTVNAEHQRKIEELTELTNDMDNLLRSTDVGTLFLDADLRIRKFTPRISETFQLLPQDIGRPLDGFTHTLAFEGLMECVRHVLETGDTFDHEVQDARGTWYLLRLLPYRAGSGIDGVVLTLIDISDIKRSEALRRRSEERYAILSRAVSAVLWTTDADGRFAQPQHEWEAYTGQDWNAHRDLGWLDAVHPDDRAQWMASWRAALEKRAVFQAQGRLWSREAQAYRHAFARGAPILDDAGKIVEWIGNVIDVHDATITQAALREKDEQLQGILRNSPASIYAKDLQGRYLLANAHYADLLGTAEEDILGRTDEELLPQEVAARVRDNDRRIASAGAIEEFEETLPTPHGPRTFVSVKFPLRDAAQRIYAVAGISTDITERKKMEERDRLALVRRDQFLAMLSHELRNPLHAVQSAAELLADERSTEEVRRAAGGVIQRQSRQMARLLDDLLDLSRITQNKIRLERQPVDLRRVAELAVEACQARIDQGRLTVAIQAPDEPLVVHGDAARLQQLLVNLITNAVKYTTDEGRIDIVLAAEGDDAVVRVRDSGVGIPAEMLDGIFDLFVQGDGSKSRHEGGMGVGLTLARSIAELHKGSISASSEGPNRGSEFTVRLPRSKSFPRTQPVGETPPAETPFGKLLLIEDNDDSREMLRQILQYEGYEVSVARDGQEGLERIAADWPDVALVDIGLPVLDGYELARRVRQMFPTEPIRLIALTGYGLREDREAARQAGFDDHLVKPLRPGQLAQLLRRKPK